MRGGLGGQFANKDGASALDGCTTIFSQFELGAQDFSTPRNEGDFFVADSGCRYVALVDLGSFGDFGLGHRLLRSATITADKREGRDFARSWRDRGVLLEDAVEDPEDIEEENDGTDEHKYNHEHTVDIHNQVVCWFDFLRHLPYSHSLKEQSLESE